MYTDIALDIGGSTYEFIYDGTTWQITSTTGNRGLQGIQGISGTGGGVGYGTYTYTGNNITTTFSGTINMTVDNILVIIDGIVKTPITDYTISNNNIVFNTAPILNSKIQIRILGGVKLTKFYNFIGTVQQSIGTIRWYPEDVITISSMYLTAGIPPVNGNLTLNLLKNGNIIETIILKC